MRPAADAFGPDPIFADPRLARIYDDLDGQRDDLAAYLDLVDESGATSIVDIGCGTGSFACMLAGKGLVVVAIDPAAASLAIARTKPDSARVRWILGDATTVRRLRVDLVIMTGNVAQIFLTDHEWRSNLQAIAGMLRPAGRIVFEVRDPGDRAWRRWNREESYSTIDIPEIGLVESWVELLEADEQLVSFRWTYRFRESGEVLTSDSTLRFRSRSEIEASLSEAGFLVLEVRDAPGRPKCEFVFVAVLRE